MKIAEWLPPNMSNDLYKEIKSKVKFMLWFQDMKKQIYRETLKEVKEALTKKSKGVISIPFEKWLEAKIKEVEK